MDIINPGAGGLGSLVSVQRARLADALLLFIACIGLCHESCRVKPISVNELLREKANCLFTCFPDIQ